MVQPPLRSTLKHFKPHIHLYIYIDMIYDPMVGPRPKPKNQHQEKQNKTKQRFRTPW